MNYISLFGKSIPTYGILIFIGLALGNLAVYFDLKKRNQSFDDFILIETYGLAFGWIGAKLLYFWVSRNNIEWSRMLELDYFITFIRSGFVFYGGLIFGIVGVVVVKYIHKVDIKKYLSELVYCIPLVHGFGRVGCFHAGCCYGIPYDGMFSIVYHNNAYCPCDVKLFPVQLVEAICLFILAAVFYTLIKKRGASIEYFWGYIMSYSVLRFVLEFFRYDAVRGSLGALSTSQWISIIVFVILMMRILLKRIDLFPEK